MAINLVSLVSQFLTPQLVGALARSVGINEAVAQRLVAAAIPTILGSLRHDRGGSGGADRLVDTVSNSDPDLLTKLTGALSSGNVGALTEGASLLGGLLGGSGVSNIAGALSQFAGAPQAAAQSAVGAVAQATVGVRPAGSVQLVRSVVDRGVLRFAEGCHRRRAASRDFQGPGATGLLAGLGGLGAAAAQTASATYSGATSAASSAAATTSAAASRATQAASAPTSTRFPSARSSCSS